MHKKFDHFVNTALNDQQRQVVVPQYGVLLVCAGAGSGKTRVITARMAYLMLNHTVSARSIVALTFTNKAAREMKERILSFLPHDATAPIVGTFHSYCLRLLKIYAHLLPFPTFSLLDDTDQEKMVRSLITKLGLAKKIAVKQVLSYISRIKNEAITAQEQEELSGTHIMLKQLYYAYEAEKNAARCFDFDDLLLQTLQLFNSNQEFKEQFQRTVRHILVDEYQDTNRVQHALLKAMTKKSDGSFAIDSLCVVGDEDQSIYSWRGAAVTNIINFHHDFPQAELITIEQNYRSVQPILGLANAVIQHNTARNEKKLWSTKAAHDRIRLLSCMSGYQEAEAYALFLKHKHAQQQLNSCAILYRSHFQSRALEEALIRHSIPYKIIGGIQFYDRLEIKDLFAYLRLLVNPFDRVAFSRAINCPHRGLGDKFEELFFTYWERNSLLNFKEIAQLLIADNQLTRIKQEAIESFIALFDNLSADDKPSHAIQTILNKTNYITYLHTAFEQEEAEAKRDNIKELINGIAYFEEHAQEATLDQFLQEVALLQEQMSNQAEEQDQVKLMTLHAAKGLEFDVVMLAGVEDGIVPSAHAVFTPESLEEERRLLYVGITRAREYLLLSHTRYRYTYGSITDQRPSRFIRELPDEYVTQADCTQWAPEQFVSHFTQWLNPAEVKQKIALDTVATETSTLEQTWRLHQKVSHSSFGLGTIEKIEEKQAGIILTIRFQSAVKKIAAQFIEQH